MSCPRVFLSLARRSCCTVTSRSQATECFPTSVFSPRFLRLATPGKYWRGASSVLTRFAGDHERRRGRKIRSSVLAIQKVFLDPAIQSFGDLLPIARLHKPLLIGWIAEKGNFGEHGRHI